MTLVGWMDGWSGWSECLLVPPVATLARRRLRHPAVGRRHRRHRRHRRRRRPFGLPVTHIGARVALETRSNQ